MTAASGDPGQRPDYPGRPPSGYGNPVPGQPLPDPAYGSWQTTPQPPPHPMAPGYPSPYGTPYPAGYGYPGYPVERATNVLAIVSLVSSIGGLLCFIGSLAGIITGVIALDQIKRTGEKGHGLAVAGTATGAIGLVLYLVLLAYMLSSR